MYDLLIFDLDGTLFDTLPDIANAVNHALSGRGFPTHPTAAVRSMVGHGIRELLTAAVPKDKVGEVESLLPAYVAYYDAHCTVATRAFPRVKETLDRLPQRKVVATNKPGTPSRAIVKGLGFADKFELVLGEDDIGVRKPNPKIVFEILHRTGVSASRTLYIGDSQVDVDTANAAGVSLAIVTFGYGDPVAMRASNAKYKLDHFADLVDIV